MKKILCIGDSNTFGYNPRTGGSYQGDQIWTSLTQNAERRMINRGVCGKCIPGRTDAADDIAEIQKYSPDAVIIMLGTNDLLSGKSAAQTAQDMDSFLSRMPPVRCVLISPPSLRAGTWVETEKMIRESEKLPDLYRRAAEKHSCVFADSETWHPDIAFDGVHLTPAGHRTFAESISGLLTSCGL